MPDWSRWFRSRWLRLALALELVVIAAVFAGTYRLALRYLTAADAPTFISWELKPAVMMSCGYGMTEPAVSSLVVSNFIARKSGSVTCQDFSWGGAPTPAIGIAFANRYSIYGAAWAMRWRGISWDTLDAYLAFLFGVGMVCIYGLYRVATGRVLAVAGVAVLACSPILGEILALRDFVKFPCFAALWLALAWVLRRSLAAGPTATLVPMAVSGALLGVGIGLRMDALILVPLFLVVAVLVPPGFGWRPLGIKAAAIAVFSVLFLVSGGPILRSISSGSNSAHVVILGLMKPFDPGLSVESAPYDLGTQYSDGYAYTVVVSHALLKQGAQLPIGLGSPEYDAVGGRLLGSLAKLFPADVLTRGLGATFQIFRMPFDRGVRDLTEKMPALQSPPAVHTFVAWRNWTLAFFEGRELMTAVFVLLLASAFNRRLGAMGFLITLYVCAYSMLQFSRRHIFHLDAIPILMMILAVHLPISLAWQIGRHFREGREAGVTALRGYLREMLIGAGALAVVVLVFAGTVSAAQAWQQRRVTEVIDATLAAQWLPAPVTDEALADTILQGGHPVPTWYDIYRQAPERWKGATLLRLDGLVPHGTEAEAPPDLRLQYFKIELADRCHARSVAVAVKYSASTSTFDGEFTRDFAVPIGAGTSYVLAPAFYHLGSSWTRFDGFAIPAEQRACVTGIFRAADPASLPLPVLAVALGADWREQPLRQQLLDHPRLTAAGTAVALLPTSPSLRGSGWRRPGAAPLAVTAPDLDAWSRSEGVAVTGRAGAFSVVGNDAASGYQLVSPPLEVPARHVLAVQIIGSVTSGEMCVGVLDGAQQRWLLTPSEARAGLLADTQDFTQVRIVFSNCANPPGKFTVSSITYQALPSEP